jgi:dipeptidyl aminopeptidase/acylaminoacyl peptidase
VQILKQVQTDQHFNLKIITMHKFFTFLIFLVALQLSAQLPNTDIWLMDIKIINDSIYIENPVNITNRPGYDNQPSFSADGKTILFTSIRDEKQSDIYSYELKTKEITQITKTETSEYSPLFAPDGQNISVVMVEPDSTQRLWKFPKTGGKATLIMDKIDSVGYYCWIDYLTMAVWLIDKPNKLFRCEVGSQKCTFVDDSIGRSIHSITFGKIKKLFYLKGKNIYSDNSKSKIIETEKTGEGEDFCFYKTNQLLMGNNAKLYSRIFVTVGKDGPWKEMGDLSSSGIKKIMRLAVSPDGKKLAIVAE